MSDLEVIRRDDYKNAVFLEMTGHSYFDFLWQVEFFCNQCKAIHWFALNHDQLDRVLSDDYGLLCGHCNKAFDIADFFVNQQPAK